MDNQDFQKWMLRTRIGIEELSRITGLAPQKIRQYLKGQRKIDSILENRLKGIENAKKDNG